MKAIILAAGYGTRLQNTLNELKDTDRELYESLRPEVEGKQKALLKLDGGVVLDRLVEQLSSVDGMQEIYLVTNDQFHKDMESWKKRSENGGKVEIFNDGTETNESRKGAIGDILYALDRVAIEDDLLICASDSIYLFDLKPAIDYFSKHGNTIITYNEEESEMHRRGMVITDGDKVTRFVEKPKGEIISTKAALAFYIIRKEDLDAVRNYENNEKMDNMGDLISHLLEKGKDVFCYHLEKPMKEVRHDIGTVQDYIKVRK